MKIPKKKKIQWANVAPMPRGMSLALTCNPFKMPPFLFLSDYPEKKKTENQLNERENEKKIEEINNLYYFDIDFCLIVFPIVIMTTSC